MYEPLPVALPDDELFAVVVYTYDNQSGEQPGNLYYELNKSLRERSAQGRTALLQLWGGFLYYLLSGLAKLIDTAGVVYRGYPDKSMVEEQYKMGRPIQWGAFSSTSPDVRFTCSEDRPDRSVSAQLSRITMPSAPFALSGTMYRTSRSASRFVSAVP